MSILTPDILNDITKTYMRPLPRVFIETGTFKGDTIAAISDLFSVIHTFELNNQLFTEASYRFKEQKHINCHLGDSAEGLKMILSQINEPVVFWLDAHYSGPGTSFGQEEAAILRELNLISMRNQQDIILIDDARLFGLNGYFEGGGDYQPFEYNWKDITTENTKKALYCLSNCSMLRYDDDILLIFTNLEIHDSLTIYETHINEINQILSLKKEQIVKLNTQVQIRDNQIKDKETQINALINQIKDKETQINALINQIKDKETQINALINQIKDKETQIKYFQDSYNAISDSITWRVAKKLHHIIDKCFPLYSKRRLFLRLIYLMGAKPKQFIKNISFKNARNLVYHLKATNPALLNQMVTEALQLNRTVVPKKIIINIPDPEKITSVKQISKLIFPHNTQPLVSIIIPVYNKWNYTYICLKSILENTSGVDYEVIIADDCSKDQTQSMLKEISNIKVLLNKTNQGFINNCNTAALKAGGKYLLFLNNDTYAQKGWLSSMVNLAEKDEKIGAVGSKLLFADGTLQEAGSIVWQDSSCLGYGRDDNPDKPEYNFVREVDYCSGACLLVNKELFESTGGFGSEFKPSYYEDTDLCFSIRQLGYKVMYQPMSVIIHFEGITCGTDTSRGIKKYQELNKPKFYKKWTNMLTTRHLHFNKANILSGRQRSPGKRILILDDRIPTPDQGSGFPRAYRLLKFVAELGYKATFFPLDKTTPWQPYTQELQQLGIELFYGDDVNFNQFAQDRAGYYDLVLLSRPHNMERIYSTIKENFPDSKVIYDAEALFSVREALKAAVQGNALEDKVVQPMIEKEINLIKKADVIITVSETEKNLICEKAGISAVEVWGHPMSIHSPKLDFKHRRDILFVGSFIAGPGSPNEDAAIYFAGEVFPTIYQKLNCHLFIVGSSPTPEVIKLADHSITVTGFVKDLSEYYERCKIFVVPTRFAAGIPLKLAEAMCYGIPSVVTALIANQLGLTDGKEVLVADNKDEFISKSVDLYTNEPLWQKLQSGTLNFARDNFDPDTMKRKLEQILLKGIHQR